MEEGKNSEQIIWDRVHKLTSEEIIAHLSDNQPNYCCPFCEDSQSWSVFGALADETLQFTNYLVYQFKEGSGWARRRSTVLSTPVSCNNCGYMFFINPYFVASRLVEAEDDSTEDEYNNDE